MILFGWGWKIHPTNIQANRLLLTGYFGFPPRLFSASTVEQDIFNTLLVVI